MAASNVSVDARSEPLQAEIEYRDHLFIVTLPTVVVNDQIERGDVGDAPLYRSISCCCLCVETSLCGMAWRSREHFMTVCTFWLQVASP
jgi:hypothetical protein